MRRLVSQFFALNVFQLALGVLTGAIVARALGPVGRGNLAAILVPLGVAPAVLALGLTTFSGRSAAQGIDLRELVGTTAATSFLIGVVAVPGLLALVPALAQGNETVEMWLTIGFALTPIALLTSVLADMGLGLQQWGRVAAQRLIPPLTTAIGYLVLLVVDALTVASAAAVGVAGGLASAVPFLPLIPAGWPPRWSARLLRRAAGYSIKVSPLTFSQLVNRRVDQLVMVPLVSREQLGLYAVAVTIAGVVGVLSSAIRTVLFPKVASGSLVDLPGTVRRGMLAVAVLGIGIAAITPLVVPLLFGTEFWDAVPMALILLVASVPSSGATMLVGAYTAGEKVGLAGLSEVVAMVVTVVGLLVLLPPLGGTGAALVSLIAYTTNFAWLAVMARGDFGGHLRDYVRPHRGDVASVADVVRSAFRRMSG